MPIALSGVTTGNSGTTQPASIPVTFPTGAAAGHVAVLQLHTPTGVATVTDPSGWTVHVNGDGGNTKLGLWSKTLDATDITNGGLTLTRSAGSSNSWICETYSGCAGPDALSAQQATTTGTTSVTIPAVTPVANDTRRLAIVAARVVTAATNATHTAPASWTSVGESIDAHATNQRRLSFVDRIQLTGQAGVAQATATATTDQSVTYQSYSLTLAPSAAPLAVAGAASTTSSAAAALTIRSPATLAVAGGASTAPNAGANLTIVGAAPDPTPGSVITTGTPTIFAEASLSASTLQDPDAGAFILGQSLLGDLLGTYSWVDFTDFGDLVVSASIEPGSTGQNESASPGRATLVVENYSGVWDPFNATSPYFKQVEVGMPIRLRIELATVDTGAPYPDTTVFPSVSLFPGSPVATQVVRYGLFRGYVDDIVPDYGENPTVTFTCSDQLAALGRAWLRAQPAAFAGETSGVRIRRILNQALVPSTLRRIDDGLVPVAAETFGDWALPLVQRIVDSEYGNLWVDGDGKVVFYDRDRLYLEARSLTVQATFSDSGTDIDFTGLAAGRRRAELYNQATVTRDGGVEQFAEDPDSVAAYGPVTFPGQVGAMVLTDVDALELATFVVMLYKTPRTKFSEISVDATTQGMWNSILGLRRFDRIRVMRAEHGIDVQLLVEAISYAITQDSWQLTISTRDVDSYRPFILDVSLLGDSL